MLYLQLFYCLIATLSCGWLIPIYLLLTKTIYLNKCIVNNLSNSTSLINCYANDYDYSERAMAFCFGSQLGFAALITFLTLISLSNKWCFEEVCTYEIKYYDKYISKSHISESA